MTPRGKVLLLFFLSGATSLVYQVVWTRLLTLSFGSTSLAVATVLTAFMGGLALGSAWFGRSADALSRPVRRYGVLELLVGLYALATPWLYPAMEALYLRLQLHLPVSAEGGYAGTALLRFLLAVLFLLPPTVLMGGTLPVLSRAFLGAKEGAGIVLSRLYSVNTAGAVAGCLASGMLLVQFLGLRVVLLLCGAANVGIFVAAWAIRGADVPAAPAARGELRWSGAARAAGAALLLSGTAAMVYEVAWTRVLTLVLGSSTYAFTLMLATFLAGIALGSALAGRALRRGASGLPLLSTCQILVGLSALATASCFGWLPDAFVRLFGSFGERFLPFLLAESLLVVLVMLPATLALGASFPAACAVVVGASRDKSRRVGLLYALNTVGAIVGSFLAGFVLLPGIGIRWTLTLAAACNLCTALALALAPRRWSPERAGARAARGLLAGGMLLVLAFVWRPAWDGRRMTSGPYAYATQYQSVSLDERLRRTEQLFYREGPVATVTVIREGEGLRLTVDGKTEAGNLGDMTTQVLLGHLPLLLRPAAQDVLVIGFASGITAGAVGRHPVRRIDCVEIEPAMEEASRFFRTENYAIREDARFRLVLDDARSFLRQPGEGYDVIVSEPSNPWQAGSSRLFTQQAFRHAEARLAPGGLFVQWMHLYGVDVPSFQLVVRTLRAVFPHVTLWLDPTYAEALFVGSREPQALDPAALEVLYAAHPDVAESLARIGYGEPWALVRAFVLGDEQLARFPGPGPLNTDDLPLLEFRAPRSLYRKTALAENLHAFEALRPAEDFPGLLAPRDPAGHARRLLRWSLGLLAEGDPRHARGALVLATEAHPESPAPWFHLGNLRLAAGDLAGASSAFESSLAADPTQGPVHAALGSLHFQRNDLDACRGSLERALAHGEDTAAVRNNLALVHVQQGRLEQALEQLDAALLLDPSDALAQQNRVRLLQMQAADGGR